MNIIVFYPHIKDLGGVPDEVREMVCGLNLACTENFQNSDVDIQVTDGRKIFSVERNGAEYNLKDIGFFDRRLKSKKSISILFCGASLSENILAAFNFRIRGAKIYLLPYSQLVEEQKTFSWNSRRRIWKRIKPLGITLQRFYWRNICKKIICFSTYEAKSSKLPMAKRLLCPWPRPNSPLTNIASNEQSNISGRHKLQEGGVHIGYVGRFAYHQKGLDLICEYSAGPGRISKDKVTFFCPPLHQDERIEGQESCSSIEWNSKARGADLYPHFLKLNAVVLASRWDGQPRVLREAMLCGCWTLATTECHFDDIHQLFKTGATIEERNIKAFTQALKSLKKTALPERAAISRCGKEIFDPENIGEYLIRSLLHDQNQKEYQSPGKSYYRWILERIQHHI